MSEPVEKYEYEHEPNKQGSGGESGDGGDPTVERFHKRNRSHKSELFRGLIRGAGIETGKEVAKEEDFGQKLIDFVDWLMS